MDLREKPDRGPVPVPPPPAPPRTPPPTDSPARTRREEPPKGAAGAFVDRLFGRRARVEEVSRDAPVAASDAPGAPASEERPETAPPWEPPTSKEEEERRIQAEVDRRAARAQRQQAEQGRLTRAQQLALLEQQEREARQTDVYQAAQLRDQLDAHRQQEEFVHGMVRAYDAVSLDPLVLALPEGEREAFLQDVPPGLDGRKALVERAIDRIKAHARAEAEAKLKRSGAFRKQVLAEWRQTPAEDGGDDEPELVNGTGGHRPGLSMNAWLRESGLR